MWQLMLAYCVHARQCAKLFSGILCSQPPRSLGNEYTNGRSWGHFAFLEATELNRTEVQVHTLRQLWNSLAWCAVPPPLRGDAGFSSHLCVAQIKQRRPGRKRLPPTKSTGCERAMMGEVELGLGTQLGDSGIKKEGKSPIQWGGGEGLRWEWAVGG